MQLLHGISGLSNLVWFCSGLYQLFFSIFNASYGSSCKAGLVVTKSLSICLSIKDFLSPSFIKFSLAGYEILGWIFFFFKNVAYCPHSFLACRVSAKRSTVSLISFPLWVAWLFSLAALSIFAFVSTLVNLNLTIMCLGVALLEESLYDVLCISWTSVLAALLGWGSSPG